MNAFVYSDNEFGVPVLGFKVDSVQAVKKARVIAAPVETGEMTFDNKVIDPYDLVVKGTIVIDGDHKQAISDIDRMINNRDFSFYSVYDGAQGYKDLCLTKYPSLRDAAKYDWISCELVFSHVMLVQKDSMLSKSSNPENGNFRDIGYSGGSVI